MLRGNLASRPFYNERLVSLALGVIAVIVLALTVFNGYTLYHLSAQRSTLKAEIATDTNQAAEINRAAVALQRSIDSKTLTTLAGSTQEANSLIDSRTFSWTEFFGYIEKTMPMDLRLVSVTPRIEKGQIRVTMSVVAKHIDDIELFVDALQHTDVFSDVVPKVTERNDDDGTYKSDVVSFYLPPGGVGAAREAAGGRQGPTQGAGQGAAMSLWKRVFQERRAILLPLMIALVANLAVLLLGVLPLTQGVAGMRDERKTASFNLGLARMLEKQARDARASKERADLELKRFYTEHLPRDFSSARKLVAMQFLAETANRSGLLFERGQAEPADLRDSQLQRVTAKVTLSGDYNSIRKFLYAVETAQEFVIIERVALAQAGDQQALKSGALEVTLDVATYYLSDGVTAR